MYGYIYLTTNLLNNKKYIGQHKSEYFDSKYKGSGKILKQAFEKDGIENFKCEILKECFSKDELDYYEKYFIDNLDCVNSNDYYNLKPGGSGNSVKGLTYIRNIETGKCKKVFTDELEEFLNTGAYIIGGPLPHADVVKKRAASNTGKTRSFDARNNISKALKGKQLSEEHKQALRKPKSVESFRTGKVMVHKDDIYIYIDKKDLLDYLANGYQKGGKKKFTSHSKNVSASKKGKIKIINKDTNKIKYIDLDQLNYFESLNYYSPKYSK